MSIYDNPEPIGSAFSRSTIGPLVTSAGGDEPGLAILEDLDPDTPRALALDYIRGAVRSYHDTDSRWRKARERFDASVTHEAVFGAKEDELQKATGVWETWCRQYEAAAHEAERQLMEAILVAHGRIDTWRDVEKLGATWPACSFELDQVVYVVSQDPGRTGKDDFARPVLTVLDTTLHADADWRGQ
jgi:hypothetical protein